MVFLRCYAFWAMLVMLRVGWQCHCIMWGVYTGVRVCVLRFDLKMILPPTIIQSYYHFNDILLRRCHRCPKGRCKKQLGKQLPLYSRTILLCAINSSPTKLLLLFFGMNVVSSISMPIRCLRPLRRVERRSIHCK